LVLRIAACAPNIGASKNRSKSMRSIEFHTYMLPSVSGDGTFQPSSRKLTSWQAIAWPGATRIENTLEVRQCPESAEEREALGFHAPTVGRAPKPGAARHIVRPA
jgi:hypothetical protein